MLKPKKIIHLTDLHLGYEDDKIKCAVTLERVKTWIMTNCTPRSDYVIVITGDLIDNANVQAQWNLSASFIQQLSESGPTGDKYEVLVIPGNHDYGTGSNADPKFVPVFKQQYFNNPNFEYPRVKIVGNGTTHEKVAFIGLDSNEDELNPSDHRLADGEIGERQLGELENALRRNDVKACAYRVVYLHHHPFESPIFKFGHWLKDRGELKDVLYDAADEGIKVDALLFGHNHGGKPKHNKWHISRVYDGGVTGGKRKPSFIRIIEDLSDPDVDKDKVVQFTDGTHS
ncbi:metallophosphoesterase family protein [Desulfobacter curvatus]|uniref:metallophosphoesterase family protein n=1 Tax=Desulfobacter curvatus TaxID=2290 RepID=UPI000379104F|nr:metallophosphoesterase [Desulfobacter curvatus]